MLAITVHVLGPQDPAERWYLRLIAFAIGVSGAGAVSVLGTSMGDLLVATFVLLSLMTMLMARASKPGPRVWHLLAISGASAGVAMALKYTSIVFIPALICLLVLVSVRQRSVAGPLGFVLGGAAAFLPLAGPHLLTLWALFGNPVFPFMNDKFHSPYYELVSVRDSRFLPHGVWDLIAYPFYWAKTNVGVVTELRFRDPRFAFAYVAAPIGIALLAFRCWRSKRAGQYSHETRGLGLVLFFFLISYLAWASSFAIYRYAIPLEMLTGIIIVGTIVWLVPGRIPRLVLSATILVTITATTAYFQWGRGVFGQKYIDVHVPPIPPHSLVLLPTTNPVAYFIPFAEPTAQYLGIENNYLHADQQNLLATMVRDLVASPSTTKLVLIENHTLPPAGMQFLERSRLRVTDSCERIQSNLDAVPLELCRTAPVQ